jgi:hypothetical protein
MLEAFIAGVIALITLLFVYIFAPVADAGPDRYGAFDEEMNKAAKRHKVEISLDLLRTTEEILKKPYTIDLFNNAPLYLEVKDIERTEAYAESRNVLKLSHHNGQVKLLLTEIQFLTLVLEKHDTPAYVVYAGSAPSHKLSILLNLFPNVKFILVDPNEHQIMYPDYSVALRSGKPMMHRLRSQYDPEHITEMVYFTAAAGNRFRLNGRKINLFSGGSARVVPRDDRGVKGEISAKVVDFIVNSPLNLFVIEDYMTNELADVLCGLSGREAGLYFISDIRSTAEGEFPTNEHVIWNNILHYSWLKRLRPRTFMLKYHPPYTPFAELSYEKYMLDVFGEYPVEKDQITKELRENKYTYIAADHMFLQSFAPQSSTEVRLIGSALTLTTYDIVDFENRMYYYNTFHRNIGNCKSHDKYISFQDNIDNCADCAVMCHIVAEYYTKFYNTDNRQTILGLIRMILFTIGRDLGGSNIAHALDKPPPNVGGTDEIAQNIYKRYVLMKIDPRDYTRGRTVPTVENQRYKSATADGIAKLLPAADPAAMRSLLASLQTYDMFGDGQFFELDMMLGLHRVTKDPGAMFEKIRVLIRGGGASSASTGIGAVTSGACRGLSRETMAVCRAACPAEDPVYFGGSLQLDAEIDHIMTKYGLKSVTEINTFRTTSYFDVHVDGYTPPRGPKNTKYTNISVYGGNGGGSGGVVYTPTIKLPLDALVILSTAHVSEIMSKFMYRHLIANNPRCRIIAISGENVYDGDGKLLLDTHCARTEGGEYARGKCRPLFVNYHNISLVE